MNSYFRYNYIFLIQVREFMWRIYVKGSLYVQD
jgi:hypothetical protein